VKLLRCAGIALFCLLLAAPASRASQVQPPAATDGFVPANDLPPTEQLPAAPFIVGAYSFFLVLMVGYVWSIARRLNTVEKEMRTLERRQSSGSAVR
jgi:hypothetical protein